MDGSSQVKTSVSSGRIVQNFALSAWHTDVMTLKH